MFLAWQIFVAETLFSLALSLEADGVTVNFVTNARQQSDPLIAATRGYGSFLIWQKDSIRFLG